MNEASALDESGERVIPPSQGSVGSASHCLVRNARARMTDIEFWENVFGTNVGVVILDFDQYLDVDRYLEDQDGEEQGLAKPCTECNEFICGTDMIGRPMFHRQAEDDE